MTRALLLLLILCGSTLHAQQQSLVGVWQISYPAGLRVENGIPTPLMATGSLSIEARGDSLIANLVSDSSAGVPARPPVRLAAKAGGGDATFGARGKATVNINGTEREATTVSTWILRASRDALEGTVERRVEGFEADTPPPQPVTGTRRKS